MVLRGDGETDPAARLRHYVQAAATAPAGSCRRTHARRKRADPLLAMSADAPMTATLRQDLLEAARELEELRGEARRRGASRLRARRGRRGAGARAGRAGDVERLDALLVEQQGRDREALARRDGARAGWRCSWRPDAGARPSTAGARVGRRGPARAGPRASRRGASRATWWTCAARSPRCASCSATRWSSDGWRRISVASAAVSRQARGHRRGKRGGRRRARSRQPQRDDAARARAGGRGAASATGIELRLGERGAPGRASRRGAARRGAHRARRGALRRAARPRARSASARGRSSGGERTDGRSSSPTTRRPPSSDGAAARAARDAARRRRLRDGARRRAPCSAWGTARERRARSPARAGPRRSTRRCASSRACARRPTRGAPSQLLLARDARIRSVPEPLLVAVAVGPRRPRRASAAAARVLARARVAARRWSFAPTCSRATRGDAARGGGRARRARAAARHRLAGRARAPRALGPMRSAWRRPRARATAGATLVTSAPEAPFRAAARDRAAAARAWCTRPRTASSAGRSR